MDCSKRCSYVRHTTSYRGTRPLVTSPRNRKRQVFKLLVMADHPWWCKRDPLHVIHSWFRMQLPNAASDAAAGTSLNALSATSSKTTQKLYRMKRLSGKRRENRRGTVLYVYTNTHTHTHTHTHTNQSQQQLSSFSSAKLSQGAYSTDQPDQEPLCLGLEAV